MFESKATNLKINKAHITLISVQNQETCKALYSCESREFSPVIFSVPLVFQAITNGLLGCRLLIIWLIFLKIIWHTFNLMAPTAYAEEQLKLVIAQNGC
jgi:hypothetical protein